MGRYTKKTPPKASLALEHLPEIILGFESDELAPTSPLADSPPPNLPNLPPNLPPSSNRSTPSLEELDDKPTKERRINWSIEMVEQLVEVIYAKFLLGQGGDNGFKRETWIEAPRKVQGVVRGPSENITWDRCKNKWGDLKGKWKHWMKLSEMSGFGFNSELELYEAYDYVWDNLNKSEPNIIWHKTHIMPYRTEIGEILHQQQATGKGALSGADPTPIDLRLLALSNSSRASPVSDSKPKSVYNKSKKRARVENSDDEEDGSLVQKKPPQKVDLGYAITCLTEEIKHARKLKEEFQSNQQKAIRLLETDYKGRLNILAFIEACSFLKTMEMLLLLLLLLIQRLGIDGLK
jgi:hypothetical protein